MVDLKEYKEERDRMQKDLRDLNTTINEQLSAYENTLDQRNKLQAELNKYRGEIAALGE